MAFIYTFGYGGRGVEELAALVELHGATIVDVRRVPFTKQPGWSRPELSHRFHDHYVHVRALGNVNYERGGAVKLQSAAKGLRLLVEMIRAGTPPLLLCGERNPAQCHRSTIAALVAKQTGCVIVHLSLPQRNDRSDRIGANGAWEVQLGLAFESPRSQRKRAQPRKGS